MVASDFAHDLNVAIFGVEQVVMLMNKYGHDRMKLNLVNTAHYTLFWIKLNQTNYK